MSNKMPMIKFKASPGIATLAACLCLAADANARPAPNNISAVNTANTTAQFGSPLPGLNATELAAFTTGQTQFQKFDNVPVDGLGPIFNAQACVACHSQPNTSATPKIIPPTSTDVTTAVVSGITPGGASAITEMRAGKFNADGSFNPLANEDGTLFHVSSITPMSQETVPQDATIRAHRKATPLFGLGLIEAIPDAEIQANVHTTPVDGVTGRAAVLSDAVTQTIAATNPAGTRNFVGRFGWKAQESTVLAFSGDAYLNEVGITNRFFTTDLAPDGNQAALLAAEPAGITPTTLQDTPTNPALPEGPNNKDDIARFTDFMEFLAPPPTVPLTEQAEQGKQLFTQINCVACHKPTMTTGPSAVSTALSFKPVNLFSDLLLHKMGSLSDGIAQAAAGTNEMRTAPLWGLRGRAPFLHDGRASTIMEAILLHAGEALTIRNRFAALSSAQQQAIIAFLNSI